MIYELRTYTLIPGKQPQYLKLNGEVGRKVRGDKYGKFEGGWTTEFGTINQYVHLWGYADLEERNRLRAELAKNDEWTKGYIPQIRPLLLAQETKILSAALPLQPPKDTGNIYELRWYRTQVGRAGEWLDLFKAVMPTREKYIRRGGLWRSEEHTSELQSQSNLVCRLLLEKTTCASASPFPGAAAIGAPCRLAMA